MATNVFKLTLAISCLTICVCTSVQAKETIVVPLSEFTLTASPTGKRHQSYIFTATHNEHYIRYDFEVFRYRGGAILLFIAGNTSSIREGIQLQSAQHKNTELILQSIPNRKAGETNLTTHRLVSIKWNAIQRREKVEIPETWQEKAVASIRAFVSQPGNKLLEKDTQRFIHPRMVRVYEGARGDLFIKTMQGYDPGNNLYKIIDAKQHVVACLPTAKGGGPVFYVLYDMATGEEVAFVVGPGK